MEVLKASKEEKKPHIHTQQRIRNQNGFGFLTGNTKIQETRGRIRPLKTYRKILCNIRILYPPAL